MNEAPAAVIVGSRSDILLSEFEVKSKVDLDTPYGEKSSNIEAGSFHGFDALVIYRHGIDHTIPPHKINYRANIWALSQLKPKAVVAINTVGGIRADLVSGTLLLPHQLIDYSWGRASTFYEDQVGHLEFTHPYCEKLRNAILRASSHSRVPVINGGVYAVTQGPRFETPAEINRIERDGGDVVGMTGMPEAALAAELNLCYASISLVVNPAAGRSDQEISLAEIRQTLKLGDQAITKLLHHTLVELHRLPALTSNSQVFR